MIYSKFIKPRYKISIRTSSEIEFRASRRRFLTTAGSIGISIGILPSLTAGRRYVEIPIARNHDGVTRTKRIPVEAYDYIIEVKKTVFEESERRVSDSNVADVKMVPSQQKVNGYPVPQIGIEIPNDANRSAVPGTINGIPVSKTTETNYKPGSCTNTGVYDPVPGGVQIAGQDTVGTCFGKVMDTSNGNGYLMVCQHVTENKDNLSCDDPTGNGVWQPEGTDNYVGEIIDASMDGDWALVETNSSSEVSGISRNVKWTKYNDYRDFEDFYTEWGLSDLMTSNETIYQQGISSGATEGTISSMYNDIDYSCTRTVSSSGEKYGVELDLYGAPGDSGGPVFTKFPDDPDNKLAAAGHWVAYDDNSNSYDTGCDPGLFSNVGTVNAYARTAMIPSYYLDTEYSIEPWLI